MKRLLVVIGLVFISGCNTPTPAQPTPAQIEMARQVRQAQREALIARFKEVYGDEWQKKLLEYDIETEKQRQEQDAALIRAIIQGQTTHTTIINNR
jgi:hypothetical protein